MQGLKALPWFQDAVRRDREFAKAYDCKQCKMNTPQLIRMSRGCGYEPTTDRVHLTVWQPPSGSAGYQGDEMTVCPGYTCNLPEVVETSLARVHWKNGNVSFHETVEDLLNAIVILESQHNQLQNWLMTSADEGGGRS